MDNKSLIIGLAAFALLTCGCLGGENGQVERQVEPEPAVKLNVASQAFEDNGVIPDIYTCRGTDNSPPIEISGVPEGAVSLAVIVYDPDAPMGIWDHWILWNIPKTSFIPEGKVPDGAVQGRNSWGDTGYRGPCPPSGTHRYFFDVFVLDSFLDIPEGSGKNELHEAMKGHTLASGTLVGLCSA